ncbi:hypothetical protein [Gottfriedia acidiceleris]|uniref:hypothetical protein n=1 Tax=Gottfriedia acidiceleris TaxID=371036 RepID=UPI00111C080D|nr:hypothetical protein [Gottfriedia acidiceleris]
MKYRKISLLCLFSAMFICILDFVINSMFLAKLAWFLIFLFVAITIIFWRCPKCKKRLPFRFNINKDVHDYYRCPYCETKFLDGEIVE